MDTARVQQWIKENKDPRSAHWQSGLEAIMALFTPRMEAGKLTPVKGLEKADQALFNRALALIDLSPGLYAAFFPPSAANAIVPPESAQELIRIDRDLPSYKIIILRPGREERILCAEISEKAQKPGIDIFQSGALLGTYDYDTQEDCLDGLAKAVKAHAWEKEWNTPKHLAYTQNWFERVQYLGTPEVSVDKERSFFHSPTLIKSDRVDALFLLCYRILSQRYTKQGVLDPGPGENTGKRDLKTCQDLAQTHILALLNLIRELALMDFSTFSDKEHTAFQKEFSRTQEKLASDLRKA